MYDYDRHGNPRPRLPDRELPRWMPVIGQWDRCWCGEQAGHPWPGRADGDPHPRTADRELVPA